MSDKNIILASADGHVGPPTLVYRDYLESWLHPEFDAYYASHKWRWSPQSEDCFFPAAFNSKFHGTEGFDPERGHAVAWDPQLRLKAMDETMMACDVLVPDDQNTNDPPFGSGLANASVEGAEGKNKYGPSLVRAGARAYNRWMADFISADPMRLNGLILVGTLEDVVASVDEIRRAHASGVRAGVMLPLDYYLPPYNHPRYDILWATCVELGLPVVSHVAGGLPDYLGEDPLVQRAMYGGAVSMAQKPVTSLILGGVMERFPELNLVITELGIDWVNPTIQGLDMSFDMWPDMRASRDVPQKINFSLKPSEYFERQVFIAHSTAQRHEQFEGDYEKRVPNMIWGADIGHGEGWWPVNGFIDPVPRGHPAMFTVLDTVAPAETAKTIWGGLSTEKLMPYLQDNFFKAYKNYDKVALQAVADKIGPSPASIGLV